MDRQQLQETIEQVVRGGPYTALRDAVCGLASSMARARISDLLAEQPRDQECSEVLESVTRMEQLMHQHDLFREPLSRAELADFIRGVSAQSVQRGR